MADSIRLRFHPEATDEADAALGWYLERSVLAAEAFVQEIEHASQRIVEAPYRWPRVTHHTRRYILPSFPFSVIYRIKGSSIEALAVAHHSRKPNYWMARAD